MRRVVPAVALFFLAPLIAEYLLGDLPITAMSALIAFAPLYGGAALLIREICRRAGWGWPSILALAMAYAVVEEGILTQSLFNPDFGGMHLHLLEPGYIPALGIGASYTVFVLTLHLVWSISVPIAVTELNCRQPTAPWLGRIGLTVVALIFAAGLVLIAVATRTDSDFTASTPQLVGSAVVAASLVGLAVYLGQRRRTSPAAPGRVPAPWLLGLVSLVVTSGFVVAWYHGRHSLPAWLFVGTVLAGYAVAIPLLRHWSMRWTVSHQLALVAGALLTYTWHIFLTRTFTPVPAATLWISHVVFALGAVAVLTVTAMRLRATVEPESVMAR